MILSPADRKTLSRTRLARIALLRRSGAPTWIIKSEQIAMVLNRKGLKNSGIGRPMSDTQARLYARHVTPLLNA